MIEDAVIVRSTIDLAHNMGRRVIAEGVENKEILEILGCDYMQGFYVSEPLPAEQVSDWLEKNSKIPFCCFRFITTIKSP